MKELNQYIRYFVRLHENYSSSARSRLFRISSRLNDSVAKLSTAERVSESDLYYQMLNYSLDTVMRDLKIEEIDSGTSRDVYSNSGDFFVIKIASNEIGAVANEKEVAIFSRSHGSGAQDIFLNLYDYDRINKYPVWTISEKVIPVSDIEDINLLRKIFPTFDRVVNSQISNTDDFIEYVSKIYSEISKHWGLASDPATYRDTGEIKSTKYKSMYPDFDMNMFAQYVTEYFEHVLNRDSRLLDFDIIPGEDLKRIAKGLSIVSTTDLHAGNLGIRPSSNPSPDDIVILDFDIDV